MATYRQLRRDPVTKDLFNNRITTVSGLHDVLESSAFIAIDTEHVAVTSEQDRILHQIGMAHVPRLIQLPSSPVDGESTHTMLPHLQKFYDEYNVRAMSLHINLTKQQQNDLIRCRGKGGIPNRRSHRFGLEQTVDLEDAEAAILEFVRGTGTTNLVLIGFEMAAEWTYLSRNLSRVLPHFTAWVDLRDIAKDIVSSIGNIPSLLSLLKLFGYNWKDITPGRLSPTDGIADNACDDAVATCALAHAFLSPRNQEKLKFRQQCSQIARTSSKKKGRLLPTVRGGFTVSVRAHGTLPFTMSTGMKLARQFFDFAPKWAGIISEDEAYLTFRSREEMNHFITATNGLTLSSGETLFVAEHSQMSGLLEGEKDRQKEKQQLRKAKSSEATGSELEGLGILFPSF